jgi:hypothetical protein
MKVIIILISLLTLTSCHTYIDYVYKGTEVVEYVDTLNFEPLHLHYDFNDDPKCYYVEFNNIPYKQTFVIENWKVVKRRRFKI